MKNLFDPGVVDEIRQRIQQLNSSAVPRWGKMNVAQMLVHCVRPMELALGESTLPPAGFFKRMLGKLIKGVIISPKPYKRGLPTNPSFVTIHTEQDFEQAKANLLRTLNRYMQNQERVQDIPHPLFGKLSKIECGLSQYKHLDHHLTQFGA